MGTSSITVESEASITTTVTVEDATVEIHERLDPIVGTLRLSLDSVPESRLGEGSVTLEILQGVLFLQERAVVTASVVFKDGRRSIIQNPSELALSSSNSSIVSISDGNIITGENEGEASITVVWTNPECGSEILTDEVAVMVIVDESRPTFVPNEVTTSVPEDSPLGHTIHIVTAVIQDQSGRTDETSSDVQYRFKDGINHGGLFSLGPTSGELVLNGKLDREATDSYTLLIEATNSAQRRAEQGEQNTVDNSQDNTTTSFNIALLTVSTSKN